MLTSVAFETMCAIGSERSARGQLTEPEDAVADLLSPDPSSYAQQVCTVRRNYRSVTASGSQCKRMAALPI